jgi:predicted RND superfamily exporter protein
MKIALSIIKNQNKGDIMKSLLIFCMMISSFATFAQNPKTFNVLMKSEVGGEVLSSAQLSDIQKQINRKDAVHVNLYTAKHFAPQEYKDLNEHLTKLKLLRPYIKDLKDKPEAPQALAKIDEEIRKTEGSIKSLEAKFDKKILLGATSRTPDKSLHFEGRDLKNLKMVVEQEQKLGSKVYHILSSPAEVKPTSALTKKVAVIGILSSVAGLVTYESVKSSKSNERLNNSERGLSSDRNSASSSEKEKKSQASKM